MERIKRHHNPDGGFSYKIAKSQTHYYDLPITNGLPESDIHGTVLLTWAMAMIFSIREDTQYDWRVIKP
jgi:hypothetical protein